MQLRLPIVFYVFKDVELSSELLPVQRVLHSDCAVRESLKTIRRKLGSWKQLISSVLGRQKSTFINFNSRRTVGFRSGIQSECFK